VDPVSALCGACDWLDSHADVSWITSNLRGNAKAANFASAYLLTDIVPTSAIAVAVFPFVQNRTNSSREEDPDV